MGPTAVALMPLGRSPVAGVRLRFGVESGAEHLQYTGGGQRPGGTQQGVSGWACPYGQVLPAGRQSMTAENAEEEVLKVQRGWPQQGLGFRSLGLGSEKATG